MSEETTQESIDDIGATSKIDLLKMEATQLNLKFHPSIGEAKLSAKIQKHKKSMEKKEEPVEVEEATPLKPKMSVVQARAIKRRERKMHQLELIRVQVSPMNPHMKGLKGQIFTIQNALVGRVSQYIPFNASGGWHVPRILLTEMENKKYVTFSTWEDSKGREHKEHVLTKAYNVNYMPKLTPAEVAEIRANIKLTEGENRG